ncbi:uncharacterized protein in vnfD 5'region-like [Planococcus citri]|uniref:uncharacterized protein in vnfD 5'region-like n=1 Tax=Planococcus citri TaxID=170843 RepID=UPI0031F975DF
MIHNKMIKPMIRTEDFKPKISVQNLPRNLTTFVEMRSKGMVYVDKTAFIEKILDLIDHYLLFTRPPGFGKSTFIQMLYEFFSGNKHLFNDTYIARRMPEKWTKYPIISLDFSLISPVNSEDDIDTYTKELEDKLWEIGKSYGLDYRSSRLPDLLIANLRTKYGQPVVVLIDEYDTIFKQGSMKDADLSETFKMVVSTFYDCLKSQSSNIKLLFIAGISRLSFSPFQARLHCRDLTFNKDFSSAMGFTLNEIKSNYEPSLQRLATHYGVNVSQIITNLTYWYDGYRFSLQDNETKVLNPISVISSLRNLEIKNYGTWMQNTGLAIESVQISQKNIEEFYYYGVKADYLEYLYTNEFSSKIPPAILLYNYGYLTIRRYNKGSGTVILAYPNKEIENLMKQILSDPSFKPTYDYAMNMSMREGDMDAFCWFSEQCGIQKPSLHLHKLEDGSKQKTADWDSGNLESAKKTQELTVTPGLSSLQHTTGLTDIVPVNPRTLRRKALRAEAMSYPMAMGRLLWRDFPGSFSSHKFVKATQPLVDSSG